MSDFIPLQVHFLLTMLLSLLMLGVSALLPSKKTEAAKFMPYESGIITQTDLLKKRFPIHHFLTALVFLIFDIEVIFLYPFAVIVKQWDCSVLWRSFSFWEYCLSGSLMSGKKEASNGNKLQG